VFESEVKMSEHVDVLIQNVSSQCIPNLTAVRSFKPNRVIWVYSEQTKPDMERLKEAVRKQVSWQESWLVDVRDSAQLQVNFKKYFDALSIQGALVFHLTCGTKSMALQGLMQLAFFQQKSKYPAYGVVMDPVSQYFDMVFPKAKNDAYACEPLSFKQVLGVHGCKRRSASGRDIMSLKKAYEPLQQLRRLHKPLMRATRQRTLCSKLESSNQGYYLRGGNDLPKEVQKGLHLAQDIGVISRLSIQKSHFTFQSEGCEDPFAYIRNMWMEDWIGAVLAHHDDGYWRGGYSSVQVDIKHPGDHQEFDFLGMRKNHLVYWSCKNTSELKSAQLFEIDALRDEVGGRDFHIAGLLHTAPAESGMRSKAKRLNLHLVQVTAADAEEQLCRFSLK